MIGQRATSNRLAPGDQRLGVMQIIDALDIGGLEQVSVNLANMLPKDRYVSYLCSTRREGALAGKIAAHVRPLCLNRKSRFDGIAVRQLIAFVRKHNIRVLHAHGSSLFFARLAALLSKDCVMVWHDHYGRCELNDRPAWIYRAATHGIGVICVNQGLVNWSRTALRVPSDMVWYVPNWVEHAAVSPASDLPGQVGRRIVCVANFRAQKDHMNLLRSVAILRDRVPDAHVLLVGAPTEPDCATQVAKAIVLLGLENTVTILGPRKDVASILRGSDVGVLPSISEGLPLALLEYGMAGLPVVATNVGQCGEVLDHGRAGVLVPPLAPTELAHALEVLLLDGQRRQALGASLERRVSTVYNPDSILEQICGVYDHMLARRAA